MAARNFPRFIQYIVFAILYFGCAELSHWLSFGEQIFAAFWLPSGLFLAVLLLSPVKQWFWFILVATLVNFISDFYIHKISFFLSAGFCFANALESVTAAFLARRPSEKFFSKNPLFDFMRLALIVLLLSSPLGALVGGSLIHYDGLMSLSLSKNIYVWWAASSLGVFLLTPLILVLAGEYTSEALKSLRKIHVSEVLLLGIGVAGTSALVFGRVTAGQSHLFPYLVFPFLLWATYRFQLLGATLSVLVVAIITVMGTSHGTGPFVEHDTSTVQQLFLLQTFLFSTSLTVLVLGAIIYSEERSVEQLMKVSHDLKKANLKLKKINVNVRTESREKSSFLANMSHEIRTPMSAILGYTDILLNVESNSNKIKNLKIVKKNSEYLMSLINEILDLSKIESGQVAIDCKRFSPRDMVKGVIELMQVPAELKGLALTEQYHGEIPGEVYSDEVRLRQVLINLVGNAIKFTFQGEVTIVTSVIKNSKGYPCLKWDIIDTGKGIQADKAVNLFDPFWQGDELKNRDSGTGLGLSISQNLCKALGGELSLTSELGKGSVFTVSIPLKSQMAVQRAKAKMQSVAQKTPSTNDNQRISKKRVLLAEDSVDLQMLIAHFLKDAGAEVTVADNGDIAVHKAMQAEQRGEGFDAILMDMRMPVLDGLAATKKLRKNLYHKPIIALTANAMPEDQDACIKAGCDDFLAKPVDKNRLINLVNSLNGLR